MNTKKNLKKIIVEEMYLEGEILEKIEDDTPLLNAGLGLDSLDALELVMLVRERFGVLIRGGEELRTALHSINDLASFIEDSLERGSGGERYA